MTNLNNNIFQEAVDAWVEHCELRMIEEPQQPSFEESSIDDTGIVTLRNQEGFLATYSTQRKRIMTNL